MKVKFEEKETEIDFNIQQLLICDKTNIIVLTTGNHKHDSFCGVEIGGTEEYHEDWSKQVFTVFTGTISND